MNNQYEVHCSGLIKEELTHDYNILESNNYQTLLLRSNSGYWNEQARGKQACLFNEHNKGVFVKLEGKKGFDLDAEQEHQLLILLLHRNDCKIQIKESKIIKEI